MQLSHLSHLRAVEAVIRLGTFRAAADELGLTPAAVGQRVRTLEEFLGVTLFERQPGGVVPTAAAAEVAADLGAGMVRLSRVMDTLSEARSATRLSISMTMTIAETWMPGQLHDFYEEEKEVDLQMEASRAVVDLHAGTFDFAIRYTDAPGAGHDGVPLFRGCIVPICTPGFAQRNSLTPDRGSLDGVRLIHLDIPSRDPARVGWEGWCRKMGWPVPDGLNRQAQSHQASGSRIATSGLGLVLGGLVGASQPLREGALVMPFGPQSALRLNYCFWLVWSAERRLSPLKRRFRDRVAERAALERAALGGGLLDP